MSDRMRRDGFLRRRKLDCGNSEDGCGITAKRFTPPFRYEFSWGRITVRDNKLYLWLFECPDSELLLYGLRNKGEKISVLSSGQRLEFTEKHLSVPDYHKLAIVLPEKKSGDLPEMLVIEIQGGIDVNEKSYDAADF